MSLRMKIFITSKQIVVDNQNANTDQKLWFQDQSDPFKYYGLKKINYHIMGLKLEISVISKEKTEHHENTKNVPNARVLRAI